VLAKPTSWVVGGKERTWGLWFGRNVTKRAIPFRARQWAGMSGLVSEPIDQTTATSLIKLVLANCIADIDPKKETIGIASP
jgi:hypothetical protein